LRIFRIPDITTDGSFTLGGATAAMMLLSGWNPWISLAATVITGMAAGALTGIITTRMRVHPLLAGILVMTALYSINLALMGRSNVTVDTTLGLVDVSDGQWIQTIAITILFALGLMLILLWILKTDLGIAMRATGNNERMSVANGIAVGPMKTIGLALANGLTAVSGYLLVQYQGFADINMGVGIVISGLAAVMIGESISKILFRNSMAGLLLCVVIGSVIFRLAIAQSLTLGLNPNYLKLATAVIVLAIVGLSSFKNKES
jgi:putative ABC transport system permease protein